MMGYVLIMYITIYPLCPKLYIVLYLLNSKYLKLIQFMFLL
jgi:hypothetical protein